MLAGLKAYLERGEDVTMIRERCCYDMTLDVYGYDRQRQPSVRGLLRRRV